MPTVNPEHRLALSEVFQHPWCMKWISIDLLLPSLAIIKENNSRPSQLAKSRRIDSVFVGCILLRYLLVNGRAGDASPCYRLRTKFEAGPSRRRTPMFAMQGWHSFSNYSEHRKR